MKIRTTYFANVRNLPQTWNFVSIARKTVPGFPGFPLPELMPSPQLLSKVKQDGDIEYYTKVFIEHLVTLDPAMILARSGPDPIYVCYEGKDKFCHRHLVADWFRSHGYEVEEI